MGVSVGTVQINRETVRRSDDPLLRFDLRPRGVARAEVDYRINALGLRGPETTLDKPAGVKRVAVLGDSVAFGYWVDEKDAFPRQLEAMLGAGGARVEVLDFGVPGYNLDQETEALRAKALEFSPDLVVIAFCLNDLEGVFSYELGLVQDRSSRSRTLLGRAREALLRHSLLFSWIEYRFSELEARRQFVRARNPMDAAVDAEAVAHQERVLDAKLAVLRALLSPRGIPGLVVVFPVMGGRFERYPHTATAPGRGRLRGAQRSRRPRPARLLLGLRLPRAAGRRGTPEPARPPRGRARDPRRAVRAGVAVRRRGARRPVVPRLSAGRLRQGPRLLTGPRPRPRRDRPAPA